jgi:hypothetical protein
VAAGGALAIRALEKMTHAIGHRMRMLIAGVAPEEIVLAGEFTRQWRRLGPIIETEVAAGSLIGNAPRVRPQRPSRAWRVSAERPHWCSRSTLGHLDTHHHR